GHGRAAGTLQALHRGVGIEHGYAEIREHPPDGRLAHPDRAGERENERPAHAASMALRARSPSSRGGARPKKRSKATAACPISIASPSLVRSPSARAASSSGVSNGWVTMS